ncbi:response regulator [Rhodoferax sp. AJA081-3]|uniref:response regulator n=1 Tax=Rhodoferax sp. AJA081-3 TaxID=2752316 RepID=UPI001ADEC504|nr:response regulator [Rhodoferax sp. AJA081-3]QTN28937.1 response regulator [Rhodoferax sp. AJA081-3]
MDIKRARILVVEDEKVMSTFILNNLRRIGILDLYAFPDGGSALREVSRLKPDLILTDIHMQPVGGIEFVRQLRALPNNQVSNTKVIFLSADSSPATVGEVLPLGVAGYLLKPPSVNALAAKIEGALQS